MCHLHTIAHARENEIWQDAPCPNVLRSVQRVPNSVDQVKRLAASIVRPSFLDTHLAILLCPRCEGRNSHRPQARGDETIVQHAASELGLSRGE